MKDKKENIIYSVTQVNYEYDYREFNKKKIKFEYYTNEGFKDLMKQEPVHIIGYVDLNKRFNEKRNTNVLELKTDCGDSIQFNIFEDTDKKTIGYIKVGSNLYVRIIKHRYILPIVLILLLLVSIGTISIKTIGSKNLVDEEISTLEVEDGETWDGQLPQRKADEESSGTLNVAGYHNMLVDEKNPEINLINPDGNHVYMVYKIYNGEELLFETKGIKPNRQIPWNVKECLEVGKYELRFNVSCYSIETMELRNGYHLMVDIEVK